MHSHNKSAGHFKQYFNDTMQCIRISQAHAQTQSKKRMNTFAFTYMMDVYWLNHRCIYISVVCIVCCYFTSIEVQIDQSERSLFAVLCKPVDVTTTKTTSDSDSSGNGNNNSILEPFSIASNSQFTLTDIVQHYLSMSFLRQTQLFSAQLTFSMI